MRAAIYSAKRLFFSFMDHGAGVITPTTPETYV